jgi:sensor c-di-GMP phosphodiesterase-like protein
MRRLLTMQTGLNTVTPTGARKISVGRVALFVGAALLGGCLTHWFGLLVDYRAERKSLEHYAADLDSQVRQLSDEIGAGVLSVRNNGFAPCSAPDLAFLRNLVFDSEHMRDAGRIANDALLCSASLGRADTPIPLPPPDIDTYGWSTWNSIWPILAASHHGNIVASGGIWFALNESTLAGPEHSAFRNISRLLSDHPHRRMLLAAGPPIPLSYDEIVRSRLIERKGTLYQPFCQQQSIVCVVVSEPQSAARTQGAVTEFFRIFFGVLLGLLIAGVTDLLNARGHSLEAQLRAAIRKDQLHVVYQPVIDLDTGAVAGAEALIRWSRRDGIPISPAAFMALAEDRGFAGTITSFVMQSVVSELSDLLAQSRLRIAINITAEDITNPRFLPELSRCCDSAAIPHSALGLELTERSTADSIVAGHALAQFRDAGYAIYIDDFGTGYSSLAYLHTLPVDFIKIDRIFTQTVGTEAVTASVVPQILDIARRLGLQIVVEGIETWEQAEYFRRAMPRIQGQGWLYSKPLSAQELRTFLAENPIRLPAPPATPSPAN